MTRRVKNSLAERRLLLEAGISPTSLDKFLWDLPAGRTPTGRITTNSLDLKPKSLTYEMLLETKKMVEEMEIGNYQIIPADFSLIEKRIIDSVGIPSSKLFFERPRTMYEWPPPYRTRIYENHLDQKALKEKAQAAERTRKSYEELFI